MAATAWQPGHVLPAAASPPEVISQRRGIGHASGGVTARSHLARRGVGRQSYSQMARPAPEHERIPDLPPTDLAASDDDQGGLDEKTCDTQSDAPYRRVDPLLGMRKIRPTR